MITTIPDKIHMANIYNGHDCVVGAGDEIPLPNLDAIVSEMSGFGILGSYSTPTPGFYENLELEIPHRMLTGELFDMSDPSKAQTVTIRGSQQRIDGEGNLDYVGMVVVARGLPTSITTGKVKQGESMDASVKMSLSYYKIEIDGVTVFELDKISAKCEIMGVDIMAKSRKLC